MAKINDYNFTVSSHQCLDEHANVIGELPSWASSLDNLLKAYRSMLYSRMFDDKAIKLQRTGLLRTYPPAIGQEAVGVGVGLAMHAADVFCSYYRDQSIQLLRGIHPEEILRYWGGFEDGNNYQNPSRKYDLPVCVPIGTQCLHAVGVAYALKYKESNSVVVCSIGDGGTSQGDFYEAINAAAVWKLPLIFVVNNNRWAISIPTEKQTAAQTIAQKAIAAGMEGVVVDGNDVMAVKAITDAAVEKARSGDGPTLIEAQTFRLCDHTTADDATRYIPKNDRLEAEKKEPLIRLKKYLTKYHHWTEKQDKHLKAEIKDQVQQAADNYLDIVNEPIGVTWDHLFENLPVDLTEQKQAWITRQQNKRGNHD